MLQATLASGWDVISPEEGYLTEELQERLQSCRAAAPAGAGRASCGQHVQLRRGELLHDVDKTVRHFYFLIEVRLQPTKIKHDSAFATAHGAARQHRTRASSNPESYHNPQSPALVSLLTQNTSETVGTSGAGFVRFCTGNRCPQSVSL